MANGRPRTFDADEAVNAAIMVFWTRGYEGASMEELTHAMGMNKSSLYSVFGSKEELFDTALARYVERDLAYVREAMNRPTAVEVAEHYLRANVEAVTAPGRPPGCLSIQGGLACGPASSGVIERLTSSRREGEAAMAARFARAIDDGDLAPGTSPDVLARFLIGVAEGNAVHAAGGATREQLAAALPIALHAFTAALAR